MKKILVACDNFRKCLTATQYSDTIAAALRMNGNNYDIHCCPLSNGSEGFLESLEYFLRSDRAKQSTIFDLKIFDIEKVKAATFGPLGERIFCEYMLLHRPSYKPIAFLEQASACGLQLLSSEEFHPSKFTSAGVGELIKHAYKRGAREIYLGLGGAATLNFGVGALQALGVKFYNFEQTEYSPKTILVNKDMKNIMDYDNKRPLSDLKLHLISDTNRALLDFEGIPEEKDKMNSKYNAAQYLTQMAHLIFAKTMGKLMLHNFPYSGAGEGLAGGLISFFDCKSYNGAKFFLDAINIQSKIQEVDIVITGTKYFKLEEDSTEISANILEQALSHNKRTIVICQDSEISENVAKKMGIEIINMLLEFGPFISSENTISNLSKKFSQLRIN